MPNFQHLNARMKKAGLILLFMCLPILLFAQQNTSSYSFGVRVIGSGKPMILIPGFKGSADTYNDVVAHYKDHYKCYVITLAGFAGQPASGVHDHLLLKQRDDIIRFIIQQKLNKPVLVGFSFGGALAQWITVTRPELISKLVDIDGTPFDASLGSTTFNKDSLIKADAARYARLVDETPAFWKKRDSIFHSPAMNKQGDIQLAKLVSDTNRIAGIEAWDKASDFRTGALMDIEADTLDMRESVGRINTPILVLGSWTSWDYKDKPAGEADYRKAYANAKNVTIVFSDRGKHFLMWEDFGWMLAQIDVFLKK